MKKGISIAFTFLFACSSFASQLGKIIINHPKLGNKELVYEKKDGFAVIEGDIIIAKLRDIEGPSAVVRPQLEGDKWMDGLIPFTTSEELPFKNKLAVYKAIDYIQKKTNITFLELTSKNKTIYTDYILFQPAEGTTCSSDVGRKGGEQTINLSPRCTLMNTVHELIHAIGFWHEQSRSDRDQYVRIVWNNIEEEHKHNFDKHIADGEDIGEYDYGSIMHYSQMAFTKNGQKTIIPLTDNVRIGQRMKLSKKDIEAVNKVYPKIEAYSTK